MWRVEDLLDDANRENAKQNTVKMQNKTQRKYKTKHRENAKQNTAKIQNKPPSMATPNDFRRRHRTGKWAWSGGEDAVATPFDGGMPSLP